MRNKVSTSLRSVGVMGIAAANLILVSGDANAQTVCTGSMADHGLRSEVNIALSMFGSRLVAVGRVDAVSDE